MITNVAFSLLSIFCHVNSLAIWHVHETLFSDLLTCRHMVFSSVRQHKEVYISSFIFLMKCWHAFLATLSNLENSKLIDRVAVTFWSWLYPQAPFFGANIAGMVPAMVGKATSIFTGGTSVHLDVWNSNFWYWERLLEMGKAVEFISRWTVYIPSMNTNSGPWLWSVC